ncbi:flagellar hook-length control protein FliK [Marinobacter fonticola]|uniref:flagellar hook-length control protein FliK n=1 Tax=Marinobacter fonticola TaxID=2603215 RepID=UPI0011E6FECE|nr:flagellar hook-length control protein FliK [Marinobacter fonticola]
MKIPVPGQSTPPSDQSTSGKASTAKPAGDSQTAPQQALSPRQLLDQLQLRHNQESLARVTQVLQKTATAPEQLLLEVRGKALLVNSDTRLQPGDLVKIMRAGNELRLLGQIQSPTTPEARIAQQLAQHLPWQHKLDQGLAQLAKLLQNGATSSIPQQQPLKAPMAESVQAAVRQLVQQLPSSTTLASLAGSPSESNPVESLRTWIRDSGLFAESRLAQAPQTAQTDLKLALNRVITTLLTAQGEQSEAFNRLTPLTSQDLVQSPLQFPQPPSSQAPPAAQESMTTGQMLRLLAGMLNRITVNQLHSQTLTTRTTVDAPAATPTWLLELPWLDAQNQPRTAQMRIERHGGEEERADRPRQRVAEWRLTLAMDLDEAGTVTFEMGLQKQQVSARIWAEKSATLRQANAELPALRQRLGELGLDVVELECRRGQPQGSKTQLDHRLVDVRA